MHSYPSYRTGNIAARGHRQDKWIVDVDIRELPHNGQEVHLAEPAFLSDLSIYYRLNLAMSAAKRS
jgi:hypothetical protein